MTGNLSTQEMRARDCDDRADEQLEDFQQQQQSQLYVQQEQQ